MVVESYGVWKAKPVRYTYENRHEDSVSPHLFLYFTDDEAGEGRAGINIKSGNRQESRLAYWVISHFTHDVTEKLAALNDGFHLLAGTSEQGPRGLALDFIRSNLFRQSDGRKLPHGVKGPGNDILDQLKPILDRAISADATAYIYGSHFSNGKGIRNVHMNQGNSRRWARDNGVFQDGALILRFEDHWEAVFVGFISQAVNTEDGPNRAGQPLPGTGYMTWAKLLTPELTGGDRARDDLADSPVFIIQALVNPSGLDNQPETAPDTVTLANRTDQDMDFSGWRIRNKAGQTQELPSGLHIAAKGTVRVEVPRAPLSNQGDTITLLNAQGLKVHGVSYTKHVASATKQHHIHQTSSCNNSALIVIFLSTRRDDGASGHGEHSTSSSGLSEYTAITMTYHPENGESAIWRAKDIYSLAQRCKDLFVLYLNISSPYKSQVSGCQRRFLTWASFLGVFADESASLDRRLQSYPEIKELVQLMLQVLQRNLERSIVCHALIDPTSADKVVKNDGAMYGITGAVERLHRLALAIRQSQRTNEAERVHNFASKQKNDSFPTVIKEMIQVLFPDAECSMQAQLAESIIYRRYRLLYERETKEMSQPSQDETTESDAPKKVHQSMETRTKKAPFENNPAESVYSPTVPSQRPLHNIENKPFLRVQEKSQHGDMRSIRSSNPPLTALYPDPPEVAVGETKMPCRYCLGDIEVLQTADEKQKKALWEAHLKADLKPYVCVSEECESFPASFSTAKEWKAHMWNHRVDWARYIHRIKWKCPFCSDKTASFLREDMLVRHLTQDQAENHPAALDAIELARIKINSKVANPRNENDCPLCGAPPWNNPGMISKEIDVSSEQSNDLYTHFLAHLQHLALLSICWWDVDIGETTYMTDNGAEKTSATGSPPRSVVLDWLTPIDYVPQHNTFSSQRLVGSGQWFLKSVEFIEWVETENQTLFCPGILGAGKTMLTSAVVDELISRYADDKNTGIAYIYFGSQQKDEPQAEDFLASLLKQLVEGRTSLPDSVKFLYKKHKDKRTRPSVDDILAALHSTTTAYSRVVIVIDALDECPAAGGCRATFMSEIFALQHKCRVNIYATSRPIREVTAKFNQSIKKEIFAYENDVRLYLEAHMGQLPSFVQRNQELQKTIEAEILAAVGGMFLLARIYLDSLKDKLTVSAVKIALQKLPKQDQKLSTDQGHENQKASELLQSAYNGVMQRIDNQRPGLRDLANQVLKWITYTKRPLTASELQLALAVQEDTSKVDEDNFPHIEDMISACAGLVAVDDESDIIRLVHCTAHDYLKVQKARFPNAETEIMATCVTYLSLTEGGFCHTDQEFEARLRRYPFYDYTACNWGHHARMASSWGQSGGRILCILKNDEKLSGFVQAMMAFQRYPDFSQHVPQMMTGVHVAAYFGLFHAIEELHKNGAKLDAKDTYGRSPLSWAAQRGNTRVVEWLLKNGADPNSKATEAFMNGCTPLWFAAENGHDAVVNVLVAKDGVESDSEIVDGQTPLSRAARNGHEAVVKLLLDHGARVNSTDDIGRTPLSLAARNGHEAVVKVLLGVDQIDVHAEDKSGQTPLDFAKESGHEAVVRLLLYYGAHKHLDTTAMTNAAAKEQARAAKQEREIQTQQAEAVDNLRDVLKKRNLAICVGPGVTLSSIQDAERSRLTWTGLVNNGFNYLERELPNFYRRNQAAFEQVRNLLDDDTATPEDLIEAATKLRHFFQTHPGKLADWLSLQFKHLSHYVDSPTVLESLKKLHQKGALLMTTNYDGLIETYCNLPPLDSSDKDKLMEFNRRQCDGVFHPHGYWKNPQHIILDAIDYYKVQHDDGVQETLRNIFTGRTVLFVGCGGGLADPNIGVLLKWLGKKEENIGSSHYILLRRNDINPVPQLPLKHVRCEGYDAIGPWLENLLDNRSWNLLPEPRDKNSKREREDLSSPGGSHTRGFKLVFDRNSRGEARLADESEIWIQKYRAFLTQWIYPMYDERSKLGQKARPIRIAILDVGFNRYDPFIQGANERIKETRNFVADSPSIPDATGRGTHALALLLELAPGADVIVARVAEDDTFEGNTNTAKAIAQAVLWATEDCKAHILVLPFSMNKDAPDIKAAIRKAFLQNTTVFSAAVSSGLSGAMGFPASVDGVIAVIPRRYSKPQAGGGDIIATLGECVRSSGPPSKPGSMLTQLLSGSSVATVIAAAMVATALDYANHILREDIHGAPKPAEEMRALINLLDTGHRDLSPWALFKEGAKPQEVEWDIRRALPRRNI